jgi:hypothetical protein
VDELVQEIDPFAALTAAERDLLQQRSTFAQQRAFQSMDRCRAKVAELVRRHPDVDLRALPSDSSAELRAYVRDVVRSLRALGVPAHTTVAHVKQLVRAPADDSPASNAAMICSITAWATECYYSVL